MFLRFFEAAFKKTQKKRNQKFEVSDFADFHYMESPLQLKNNVCL